MNKEFFNVLSIVTSTHYPEEVLTGEQILELLNVFAAVSAKYIASTGDDWPTFQREFVRSIIRETMLIKALN